MQLICPHCGKPVSAENINIQRMVAVCPACDTVFQFDPPDAKIKRRKVKQPPQITADEADHHLTIAFRTNFRLDKSESFITSALLSVLFTFITVILVGTSLAKPTSLPIALGFALFTLASYYWLGLATFNKTQIEISDEKIEVSRKPLPNFLTQPTTIGLSGVERIRYEETAASKKEGYDTPRYNVWAEMVDGNRKFIATDVIEEYAVFISQRMNEFLDLEAAPDGSRLLEDEREVEADSMPDQVIARSKSSSR